MKSDASHNPDSLASGCPQLPPAYFLLLFPTFWTPPTGGRPDLISEKKSGKYQGILIGLAGGNPVLPGDRGNRSTVFGKPQNTGPGLSFQLRFVITIVWLS